MVTCSCLVALRYHLTGNSEGREDGLVVAESDGWLELELDLKLSQFTVGQNQTTASTYRSATLSYLLNTETKYKRWKAEPASWRATIFSASVHDYRSNEDKSVLKVYCTHPVFSQTIDRFPPAKCREPVMYTDRTFFGCVPAYVTLNYR